MTAQPELIDELRSAGRRLGQMAVERFREHGPDDPRGAAIYDCAAWIEEVLITEVQARRSERKAS